MYFQKLHKKIYALFSFHHTSSSLELASFGNLSHHPVRSVATDIV
jgi:hypothetical protein